MIRDNHTDRGADAPVSRITVSEGNAPDRIVISDTQLLFTAKFTKAGADLILTGGDGQKVVVSGYFGLTHRPDLMAPGGAVLTAKLVEQLAGPENPGQYAQAGAPAGAIVIGKVERIGGSATVQHANGVVQDLKIGDAILQGDIVETRDDGQLGLSFIDGTAFNMGAAARMALSELVYSAGSSSNSAVFSLVKGTIAFVAGQVAKTGDMRVETPVATMGIRGTSVVFRGTFDINNIPVGQFSLTSDPNGDIGSFDLTDPNGVVLARFTTTDNIVTVRPAPGGLTYLAQITQKTPAEIQQEIAIAQILFPIFISINAPSQDLQPRAPGAPGSGTPPELLQELSNDTTINATVTATVTDTDSDGNIQTTTTTQPVSVVIAQNLAPLINVDPAGHLVEETAANAGVADAVAPIIKSDIDGTASYDFAALSADGWTNLGGGIFTKSGTYGIATLDTNADTLTFALNNGLADGLTTGQQFDENFVIPVIDNEGVTASAVATFTVEGRNDAPVIVLHSGGAAFMTGTSNPWNIDPSNPGSPQAAMDVAFGAGEWTMLQGFATAAFTNGEYGFIYLDGGDGISGEFDVFISENTNLLETFVNAGGHLFINAARWTSGDLDLGFGATLHGDTFSSLGFAIDPSNLIFLGPHGNAGTSWTGNWFSHDTVTGLGLTALIGGTAGTVLAMESFGAGMVFLGGMTAPYFHSPSAESGILLANILSAAGGPGGGTGGTVDPAAPFASLDLSDVDNATFVGATISIVSGFAAAEDLLTFSDPSGNISGVYHADTGILELTGLASVAEYEAALQSIAYSNSNSDPTGTERTISVQVNDGGLDNNLSNIVSATIQVVGVNDAPVIHNIDGEDDQTNEDTPLLLVAESDEQFISDSDVGSDDLLMSLSVLHGTLAPNGVVDGLIAVDGDGSDGTLSFRGSLAAINNAIHAGIVYMPTQDFFGHDPFTITIDDLGHNGTGGAQSATATVDINIEAINDAPVTTPVVLAAIAEDSGPRLITQAELLANASDVDGPLLMAINLAITSGNGTLHDNDDGTWSYDPAENDTADVAFSYQVTDGVAAPIATTASLDITPENDPPVIAAGTTATGQALAADIGGGGDDPQTPLAASYLTAGHNLVNGLGGTRGFGENVVAVGDDNSTGAIEITSIFGAQGLNFFGNHYTSLFINNNGNITFASATSQFTPSQISGGAGNPIIAPFWADVDTRGGAGVATPGGNSSGSNRVFYDIDSVNGVLTVTWDDVGYYNTHTNKFDAFQLQLISLGGGNFDIVFRYEDINWVTGDASGGTNGLGGTPARAGYSAGDGVHYFEVAQSGNQSQMLALESSPGVEIFSVINGAVVPAEISTSGHIFFTDAEFGDTHTISDVQFDGQGQPLGQLSLVKNGDTDAPGHIGEFTWTYVATSAALATLGPDEIRIESFIVTISDGNGGFLEQTVTVDLHGTDQTPIVNDDHIVTNIGGSGSQIIIPDVALLFNDTVANNQPISVNAVGNAFSGSVLHASGISTFTDNNADGGVFTYFGATSASTSDVGIASIDRTQSGQSQLTGTALDEILIARSTASNTIVGHGGNDALVGGTNIDAFLFDLGDGHDLVTNFLPGTDIIQFDNVNFSNFSELQGLFQQQGADLLIAYSANDNVLLKGIDANAVHASDFIIHHA